MTTDTREKGLETLIIDAMTGSCWLAGNPEDYDREYCVDLTQLSAFLNHIVVVPTHAIRLRYSSDDPVCGVHYLLCVKSGI